MEIRDEDVRRIALQSIEAMLELQLRAVRQLIGSEELPPPVRVRRGLRKKSLTDLSAEVLKDAGKPLHVDDIVRLLVSKFGRVTDRDALSSGIGKLAKQGVVFESIGKGVFGLLEGGNDRETEPGGIHSMGWQGAHGGGGRGEAAAWRVQEEAETDHGLDSSCDGDGGGLLQRRRP